MNGTYIPAATLEKLIADHPEGTRHHAKIEIALPLLGNGLPASAVLETLLGKFPNATRRECEDVVNWCVRAGPSPSGFGSPQQRKPIRATAPGKPDITLNGIIGDAVIGIQQWIEASKIEIPEEPHEQAAVLIENLYEEGEFLCACWKHGTKPDGRTFPYGSGCTLSREKWIVGLREKKRVPRGEAGTWWRMNPVKEAGSGKEKSHTDKDVTAFRYALVEHDKIPIEDQLAVLSRFQAYRLPIVAVILTGGKSVHAWVRINARDEKEYAERIEQLLSITEVLGFDHNKNPSRFARICGAPRKLGAVGDGMQRLIFLNPTTAQFDYKSFVVNFPTNGLISGANLSERVAEWMKPRKPDFTLDFLKGRTPYEGFYFRPAEVTVWSGVTGHGKSSLIAQTIIELMAIHKCFIASLEHKAEQICELFSWIAEGRAPTAAEVDTLLKRHGNRFYFADTVGEIDPSELFRLMRAAHKKHDVSHFFIDSLMRVSGLEEDYPRQLEFVNELQAFAKESNGHVHLVAHPRKIDETGRVRKMDLKGSSSIPNNADNVICVRRNVQKQECDEKGKAKAGNWDAEIAIEKQRATGWQGAVKLRFDPNSKRFTKYHSAE